MKVKNRGPGGKWGRRPNVRPDQAPHTCQVDEMGSAQAPGPEGRDQGREQKTSRARPVHRAQSPQLEPLTAVGTSSN